MNDFMEKPIKIDQLLALLTQYATIAEEESPILNRPCAADMSAPSATPAQQSDRKAGSPLPDAQPPTQLDLEVLEGLGRMLGAQKMLFYVRNFTDDAVRMNARIAEAGRRRDPTELQSLAHKLKGVAGSVGIMAVAARAEAIDAFAKSGDLEQALQEIPLLGRDLDDAVDLLRVSYPAAFE